MAVERSHAGRGDRLPDPSSDVDLESPLTILETAAGLPLDTPRGACGGETSLPKASRRPLRGPFNRQLLRSHPAIDPEETRDPVAQEGPEAFSLGPRAARATGDEPSSLLVSHDSIVVVCRPTDVFGPDAPGT
jgi:hypothetical protein